MRSKKAEIFINILKSRAKSAQLRTMPSPYLQF